MNDQDTETFTVNRTYEGKGVDISCLSVWAGRILSPGGDLNLLSWRYTSFDSETTGNYIPKSP